MKTSCDIIIRPIITEASMQGIADKKYTFEVAKTANKVEIKKAIEEIFKGAKVLDVNTSIVNSKPKRLGVHMGRTSEWKKAVVTLTADSKTIEFFDGMM